MGQSSRCRAVLVAALLILGLTSVAGAAAIPPATHHHARHHHHRAHRRHKRHRSISVRGTSPGGLTTPGSCAGANLVPSAANLGEVRQATLCLVNSVRGAHGLARLSSNGRLESAAQGYSKLMVLDNFFSHVSPGGLTPLSRILAVGYLALPLPSWGIGENLAWGQAGLDTPAAIVGGWVKSPMHLANILAGRFRDTGIGVTAAAPRFLAGGGRGATYVEDFGFALR